MRGTRVLVALIVGSVVAAACNSPATPAPSANAVAAVSPSVAAASLSPAPSTSPSPSPSATAAPTPTATPVATPTPTPVPWKTYKSKLFKYKMSYPPDWVVTPGSAKFSDLYDSYGHPYVYVTRDTVSGIASVNLTVSGEISYMKSHYKAKLISNASIKLASGFTGRVLTFTGIDDGLKVYIKEVIVAKGRVGYFLTMFAERATATADTKIFRKMYGSWRPL